MARLALRHRHGASEEIDHVYYISDLTAENIMSSTKTRHGVFASSRAPTSPMILGVTLHATACVSVMLQSNSLIAQQV